MQQSDLNEAKQFVKKFSKLKKKLKKEGRDSSGAGAYATPKAFTGDSSDEGSNKATGANGTYYIIKPKKEKRFFIGYKDQGKSLPELNEANYKQFKEDASMPNHKKINEAILEINRKISEINKILEHSIKLKNESQVGDNKLWKRTNEALLKIHKRLSEATKRTKSFANLKEIESNSVKDKMGKLLMAAGLNIPIEDIDVIKRGNTHNIDVTINGEPSAFDLENDTLVYQAYDRDVELGNINREQDIINNLKKIF